MPAIQIQVGRRLVEVGDRVAKNRDLAHGGQHIAHAFPSNPPELAHKIWARKLFSLHLANHTGASFDNGTTSRASRFVTR